MHRSKEATPIGLLLLSQPDQIGITLQEMTEALPEGYRALPRHSVAVEMVDVARQAAESLDFTGAQRTLEKLFHEKVAPSLEQHPDFHILYFGTSLIPLAVHLGFLLQTWHRVEVVPHHHGTRMWGFGLPSGRRARLAQLHLPDYRDRTPGEAIVRVSTSHRVDAEVTRRAAPAAMVEIDVALEHPEEDAFTSMAEMETVAGAFRRALDTLGDQFPGIERVHLFASVQPGMALLLGAQISKTMHPPVQTYLYARNAENGPLHLPALLVNGPPRPAPLSLTAEQEAQSGRDREQLVRDIERMKGFATREKQRADWLESVLEGSAQRDLFTGRWRDLPALHGTPLPRTKMDVSTRSVEDSFRLASEDWQIDDAWLARLAMRIPEAERRHRALRMLVLHEAAHRGPQALTRTSSQGIGRFPKVLEEIDYHADVWAMLHEHTLTRLQSPSEAEPPRRFFMQLIRVATETMWVFDDGGAPLREIQIRRLHRYLIWYWQYLLLERGSGGGEEMTLDAVLAVLSCRPLIELAGPSVVARSERVFFDLTPARAIVPEVAVYHAGRLFRHGARFDFPITGLLEGARDRDGEKILEVLRAAVEQTVR